MNISPVSGVGFGSNADILTQKQRFSNSEIDSAPLDEKSGLPTAAKVGICAAAGLAVTAATLGVLVRPNKEGNAILKVLTDAELTELKGIKKFGAKIKNVLAKIGNFVNEKIYKNIGKVFTKKEKTAKDTPKPEAAAAKASGVAGTETSPVPAGGEKAATS